MTFHGKACVQYLIIEEIFKVERKKEGRKQEKEQEQEKSINLSS